MKKITVVLLSLVLTFVFVSSTVLASSPNAVNIVRDVQYTSYVYVDSLPALPRNTMPVNFSDRVGIVVYPNMLHANVSYSGTFDAQRGQLMWANQPTINFMNFSGNVSGFSGSRVSAAGANGGSALRITVTSDVRFVNSGNWASRSASFYHRF